MNDAKFYPWFDCHTQRLLCNDIIERVKKLNKTYNKFIIVCIGNNQIIEDIYGPLTGHFLSKIRNPNFKLYGTLRKRINAKDLPTIIPQEVRDQSLIFALDARLGREIHKAGYISVETGSIRPGSAYGKGYPPIGDISISGISGVKYENDYECIKDSLPAIIFEMAEMTATALKEATKKLGIINRT